MGVRMTEQDHRSVTQGVRPEELEEAATDRELSDSDLDKVSGGAGLPPDKKTSFAHDM
jgi:hypothetical protein